MESTIKAATKKVRPSIPEVTIRDAPLETTTKDTPEPTSVTESTKDVAETTTKDAPDQFTYSTIESVQITENNDCVSCVKGNVFDINASEKQKLCPTCFTLMIYLSMYKYQAMNNIIYLDRYRNAFTPEDPSSGLIKKLAELTKNSDLRNDIMLLSSIRKLLRDKP